MSEVRAPYLNESPENNLTVGDTLRKLGHVIFVLEDGHHHLLDPRTEVIYRDVVEADIQII